MAAVWTAKIINVKQDGDRGIVGAEITKTPDLPKRPRTWPYRIEYLNVADMTLAKVKHDVTKYAKTLSVKGSALEQLENQVNQPFTLDMS
jgi:phosphoenolpyruvate carboxylase